MSGNFTDMTPQQRIGTSREMYYLNQDDYLLRKNLQLVGQTNALKFFQDRMTLLIKARNEATTDEDISHFQFRIDDLNMMWEVNPQGGTDIRYRRLQWGTFWKHTVSGSMKVSDPFKRLPVFSNGGRDKDRWIVEYYMGFYDTDSQSAFVDGSLIIPLQN